MMSWDATLLARRVGVVALTALLPSLIFCQVGSDRVNLRGGNLNRPHLPLPYVRPTTVNCTAPPTPSSTLGKLSTLAWSIQARKRPAKLENSGSCGVSVVPSRAG